MSTAQVREVVAAASVVGLTLEQYVRMIEEGILISGTPIELIDGLLVCKDRSKAGENPMTIGFDHVWAVKNLGHVVEPLVQGRGCYVSLQSPLAIPPDSAAEPDGAVTRGSYNDYRSRYPTAADVPCVIEVADSSLNYDRVTKKRIYARAGIFQYVIINLVDRVVEIFDQPLPSEERFARDTIRRPDETVPISTGDGPPIEIPVSRLLPPT